MFHNSVSGSADLYRPGWQHVLLLGACESQKHTGVATVDRQRTVTSEQRSVTSRSATSNQRSAIRGPAISDRRRLQSLSSPFPFSPILYPLSPISYSLTPAPFAYPHPYTLRPPHSCRNFPHIFIIILENKEFGTVIGPHQGMPNLNLWASEYTLLTEYYAIRHPSLPNYLALIGGDTFGVDTDCNGCYQNALTLPDLIEASGRTWKGYFEDMPEPCYAGDTDIYVRSTTRSCISTASAWMQPAASGVWCRSPSSTPTWRRTICRILR